MKNGHNIQKEDKVRHRTTVAVVVMNKGPMTCKLLTTRNRGQIAVGTSMCNCRSCVNDTFKTKVASTDVNASLLADSSELEEFHAVLPFA